MVNKNNQNFALFHSMLHRFERPSEILFGINNPIFAIVLVINML